jgi:uncharacterized protein (DUF4415 family)
MAPRETIAPAPAPKPAARPAPPTIEGEYTRTSSRPRRNSLGNRPVKSDSSSGGKSRIGLRIDNDVLAALKAQGGGWQSRVNQILRAAVFKV